MQEAFRGLLDDKRNDKRSLGTYLRCTERTFVDRTADPGSKASSRPHSRPAPTRGHHASGGEPCLAAQHDFRRTALLPSSDDSMSHAMRDSMHSGVSTSDI